MPFLIPSKLDLVKRSRAAFRAESPGTDADLWPSNVYVSAKVLGGMVWEVMGRLKWIDKQRFAMTATGKELEAHAAEYGMGRRPATYAAGNMLVPASFPYTVPAGTIFTRADGVQYQSTAEASLLAYSNSSTVSVPVVCMTIGKIGNLVGDTIVTTSLQNLTGDVTVDDDGIGQGVDVELDGAPYTTSLGTLRGRVLARKRQPPQGGSAYDYQRWASEKPGVTRVFVVGNAFGPGTVAVWFMMDETYPNGIPLQADVDAVQAYIESVKPVTANVLVLMPVVQPIDVVIANFADNTKAMRESAAAEIYSMFRNMTQPSLPGDPFVLRQSWIWQAVSNAAGDRYHTINSPSEDLTMPTGIIPCLRSVAFAA